MTTETRNYLLLMALTKTTAAFGTAVLERLRADVDPKANPLWVDAGGVGIFLSTSLSAADIWSRTVPDYMAVEQAVTVKDMLVLELGSDHRGIHNSKAIEWLRRHEARAETTV